MMLTEIPPHSLTHQLPAFLPGLMLGFSLILAIGAQNAFVLRQGLRGEHVLAVALTCALSDAILIATGVAGFARLTDLMAGITPLLRYGGAAFLLFYAWRSLRAAFGPDESLQPSDAASSPLWPTLLTCLIFTWGNPHVYLDTVVLIGSVSTRFAGREMAFALGAMTASFLFFFTLAYGARLLRPLFARPMAWRLLDGVIAIIMTTIAIGLITGG